MLSNITQAFNIIMLKRREAKRERGRINLLGSSTVYNICFAATHDDDAKLKRQSVARAQVPDRLLFPSFSHISLYYTLNQSVKTRPYNCSFRSSSLQAADSCFVTETMKIPTNNRNQTNERTAEEARRKKVEEEIFFSSSSFCVCFCCCCCARLAISDKETHTESSPGELHYAPPCNIEQCSAVQCSGGRPLLRDKCCR